MAGIGTRRQKTYNQIYKPRKQQENLRETPTKETTKSAEWAYRRHQGIQHPGSRINGRVPQARFHGVASSKAPPEHSKVSMEVKRETVAGTRHSKRAHKA
jgi:hypothetical protein